jgi:hypothetical protein
MNIISRKLGNYSDFFKLEKLHCQYLYYVNNPTTSIKHEKKIWGKEFKIKEVY